jgi:hypothetical protein
MSAEALTAPIETEGDNPYENPIDHDLYKGDYVNEAYALCTRIKYALKGKYPSVEIPNVFNPAFDAGDLMEAVQKAREERRVKTIQEKYMHGDPELQIAQPEALAEVSSRPHKNKALNTQVEIINTTKDVGKFKTALREFFKLCGAEVWINKLGL